MSVNEEHEVPEERPEAFDPSATRRVIGHEHVKLEALLARVEDSMGQNEVDPQMVILAMELRDQMEAHFVREESLYYPTICELQPAVKSPLKALMVVHDDFRELLTNLVATLERGDVESAGPQIDEFSVHFGEHEIAEERILGSLGTMRIVDPAGTRR